MANTIEQIQAHPLFNTVEQLRERIGELHEREDELPEGMLERVTALAELFCSRVENSDSIMIPQASLDQTQKHLHNVLVELNNYISNNNSQHVQNAINNFSSAYQTFPSVFRIEGEDTYDKVLTALSKRAQNQIGKLDAASKKTLGDLDRLETALSETQQAIEAERQKITAGLGNVETQFTESQGSRSKAFNDALDGYSASLRERMNASEAALEKHIEENKSKFASDTQALLDQLDEVKTDSREKHDVILQLYGLVGRDSQIGGYKENAESARRAGILWDRITFFFMVLAILVLVGPSLISYFATGASPIDWTQVLSRFPISTVLLVPAAYAGAQSRRQKKAYDTAKRNQLHIAALGPYLSTLPKTAQDRIRAILAPRFFYADNSETLDIEKLFESVTSLDLVKPNGD